MNIIYNLLYKPSNNFSLIFLIHLFLLLGVGHQIEFFKPLVIILFLIILGFSLRLLRVNYKSIPLLIRSVFILIVFYPIIKILFEIIDDLSFKKVTDALFIKTQYFYLFIIGLSYSIVLKHHDGPFIFNGLALYFKRAFTIILVLTLVGVIDLYVFGDAYFVLDSLLVPSSLLLFSKNKNHKYFAIISLTLGFILVGTIASRSYFLVFLYLIIIYVLINRRKISYFKLFFFVILSIIILSLTGFDSYLFDNPLIKKINPESLFGSIKTKNNYSGDSRTEIIFDAFGNFSLSDFLTGKGFFANYNSFVIRNTIEIGWLQISFWLGFIYTFFLFLLHFSSIIKNFRFYGDKYLFFGSMILIKTLDALIYGMPLLSVYNFLVAISIFSPFVLKRNFINNLYHA